MRKLNVLTFLLSAAIASGQQSATTPTEPAPVVPAPPPGTITIPPEMLRDLPKLVVPPFTGACAIPLIPMLIPPDVNFSGKVVTPGADNSKMPILKGLPACDMSKR